MIYRLGDHPFLRQVVSTLQYHFRQLMYLSNQDGFAWCGVPSRSRLFQIDVRKYMTRTVYALREEILRKSGFKDQYCQLWKVRTERAHAQTSWL